MIFDESPAPVAPHIVKIPIMLNTYNVYKAMIGHLK